MHGQRGKKKALLPPDVETRLEDNKVRCKTCSNYNSCVDPAEWIALKVFKSSHQKSATHLRAVNRQKQEQDVQSRALQNTPNFFAQPNHIDVNVGSSNEASRHFASSDPLQSLWDEFDGTFEIDKGVEEAHKMAQKKFDSELHEHILWDGVEHISGGVNMEEIWDEEEHDDLLSELLEQIELASDSEDLNINPMAGSTDSDPTKWFPYPSKVVFLLDVIDNLPRVRISGSFMKVLLWLLRELGVKETPSFDGLRKIQKSLRQELGNSTINTRTPKGNVFAFNDPQALVAKDWANPLIRPHIRRYPVIPKDGVISEIWHAEKWRKNIDRRCLSPMYDAGNNVHYFVDEPARLSSGKIVIPVRWLEDEKGDVWAEVWEVQTDVTTKLSTICDTKVHLVRAQEMQKNMLDLQDESSMPNWDFDTIQKGHLSRMPNPDRILAEGDPIYTSFIDIFGDDVSGNRSKSWNKHWNIYMNHRNLPRKILHQQYNTHFISTSTHASVPEQFHGVKKKIEETHHKPVKSRDALTGHQIRLKIYCNCAPGDNPSQSETCGHIGGKGNYPCRKCEVGGPQKEKESNDGFHKMFMPAKARSSQETLKSIKTQVHAACLGVAQTVKDMQSNTGIKDIFSQFWIDELIERARELRKTGPQRSPADIQAELLDWVDLNEDLIYNPFLTLEGFDAPLDTPIEILHTVLLGIVKYVWHSSHTPWNATQKKTYADRLQASDVTSLSIPAIRSNYIMQYANSLIGRQLKTLVQLNMFHVYDLVSEPCFELTKAIGELSALLWHVEIRNLNEYLSDIEIAAANVLDIAAELDPTKIIAKQKYHLLSHLREDIVRFGPLIGVATEIFESYNAIFRYCSILSNHLAPSSDIAHQLSRQETVKYILSGGWWCSDSGEWKQPGRGIKGYVERQSFLRRLFGWVEPETNKKSCPGTIELKPPNRDPNRKNVKVPCEALPWEKTHGVRAMNIPALANDAKVLWHCGKHVIAQSQDVCTIGSWIYASSPFMAEEPPVTGRILDILQDTSATTAVVVLDLFSIANARHELFGVPVLMQCFDEERRVILKADTILFSYNVQHDCRYAKCEASGRRAVIQERIQSDKTEDYVEHKPIHRYLINTHTFHNAHLIRAILPRHLTVPIPYTNNRQAHHDRIATSLQVSQDAKQVATARKAAEKKKQSDSTLPKSKKRKVIGSAGEGLGLQDVGMDVDLIESDVGNDQLGNEVDDVDEGMSGQCEDIQ